MAVYASHNTRLLIPVLDSNDYVAIGINGLPNEADELLEILASEAAPLSTWFDFAKAYLSQGREDAFKSICEEGIKEEVTEEVTRFFGQKPTYEQTQFHCALAALAIAKGKEEKSTVAQAELFASAASSIGAARLMNPDEQMVSISQGMLHLAKNEIPQARQEFTKACTQKNNGSVNVIGFLALARLLFHQKQYKDALLLYRRALAQNPACPPEVRLGIAACQFRLGDMAAAAAAFERVLALDPANPEALMGLAVIKFSSANAQQGLAEGLQLLVRAYHLDPGSVGTLLLLAHFCLLRGEYTKVMTLAKAALEATEVDAVKAESHCLLARALHAQGQFQAASQQYTAALHHDATAALPHLGLAQLYVKQGAALNASTELELSLQAAPTLFDALKILGQLIGDDATKTTKVLGHVKAAVGKAEDDADVWELLAELSASAGDHQGSLTAYKRALAIHRQRQQTCDDDRQVVAAERAAADPLFRGGDQGDRELPPAHVIPARLLNNTAVLCYRAGDLDQATALLQEAHQVTEQSGQELSSAHRTALAFNLARMQEASGELLQAEKAYKAILESDPDYIDCMLRLACMARTKGAPQEAMHWAQKATAQQAGNEDALAIMSQLYMERRDWAHADVHIKQLLARSREGGKDGPATDGYGHLAYANLLLSSAPSDRRKEADARRAENNLFKALESFRAVLKAQPRNAYAANGIGAALAELGRLDEAQDVFSEVQAAVAASGGFLQVPDVYINLANVALAKREYVTAQRLYKVAMDKLGNTKKSQVLLYLARAYYDSDDLPAAVSCLKKAMHIAPTDHKLRFNTALTLQEYSVRTYRKKRPPQDPTMLSEFQRARQDLECALRYFQHLDMLGPDRTKLDPHKLKMHIKFCTQQLEKYAAYVEAAQKEATLLAKKRTEEEAKRELEAKRKQIEQRRQQAEEEAAEKAREAEALKALERSERLKEAWRQQRTVEEAQAEAEAGKKRRGGGGGGGKGKGKSSARKMAAGDEEPSDAGGSESDAEAAAADKDVDALFDDEEEEEEAGGKAKALMDEAGLGSDDEEGGGGGGKSGGRLKSKRPRDDAPSAAAPGAGASSKQEEDEEESDDAFLRDLEEPQVADTGLEDDEGAGPAKRVKRGAALADSDEDAEAPPASQSQEPAGMEED